MPDNQTTITIGPRAVQQIKNALVSVTYANKVDGIIACRTLTAMGFLMVSLRDYPHSDGDCYMIVIEDEN